jgi:hypothetical protein
MTKYEIEIERVTYITYTVEAEDQDEAEEKALHFAVKDYGEDATYQAIDHEEFV